MKAPSGFITIDQDRSGSIATKTMPMPEIPRLVALSLQLLPEEKSLGLQIRQGPDEASEVIRISPGGPASRVPLKVGFQILSVNGRRVKNAEKCAELLKYYTAKNSTVEILASSGPLPPGALYVLVKAGPARPLRSTLDDGSIQGLFLEEKGDKVRVRKVGHSGIFVNSRINKGDVILTIDGRCVSTISDCQRALKKVARDLVPVLTYNVFRKARGTFMISSSGTEVDDGETERKHDRLSTGRDLRDLYEFGEVLGTGSFSTVRTCRSKHTGEIHAVKMVNRDSLTKSLELALKEEIAILNELDHPHVLKLVATFSTIKTHYLVLELLEGGELFDRIVEKSSYTENEARDLSKILFGAIEYCHDRNICHRDLKPENLLLKSKYSDTEIKIADFGMSRKAPAADSLETLCGSPAYVSPEILNRNRYGTQTDMWSLGVILFILIGGYPPFADENRLVQEENIKNCNYRFVDYYWGSVTDQAKALIKSLLVIDPRKRLCARDALNQPWMEADRELLIQCSLHESQASMKIHLNNKFTSAVRKVSHSHLTSLILLSVECVCGFSARAS
ncbi:hypothetical protein HJC23_014059 [Cyclotella cryptica]|uniref:non-specific serine/threonine protein kinase n=1 Tax=Cyclotella cryptica TaxID=29204 RepID=A0ABD3QV67_9STRA